MRRKNEYILIGITSNITEVMNKDDIMDKTGWSIYKLKKLLMSGDIAKGLDGKYYCIDSLNNKDFV